MSYDKIYKDNIVSGAAIRDGKGNRIDSMYLSKDEFNTFNPAKTDLSNLTEGGLKVIKDNSGSGLPLGAIAPTTIPIDEELGLQRYANGSKMTINDNNEPFVQLIEKKSLLYPSIVTKTQEEWDMIKTLSVFGQCGKYFVNREEGYIQLPLIINVQGLRDLSYFADTVAESLPNITGTHMGTGSANWTTANGNGAFKNSFNSGTAGYNGGSYNLQRFFVDFNASLSSSTYQDGAPVQPEAIQYPYFIQIATGSETENNIVNEIELNNPYSLFDSKYSDHELNNLSWLKSEGQWNAKAVYTDAYDKLLKVYNGTETVEGLSVKLSTETYTDYDFVLNTADETFRLPLKTKLASGKAVVGNGMTLGLEGPDNYKAGLTYRNDIGAFTVKSNAYGSNYGVIDKTSTGNSNDYTMGVTTDPTKSGIETSSSGLYLYYYVGETVQNANLIDAGRIGEQLANKQDKCIHIIDTYVNGTSGYRIWSDGYCEQWGKSRATSNEYELVVSLLKEYSNTDYNILLTGQGLDSFDFYLDCYSIDFSSDNKTTTSFKTQHSKADTAPCYWKTSGYLAEGEY